LQRLLAPILPFATEETWSWWQSGSVHAQRWPELVGAGGDPALIDPVLEALARVRRTKTEAKVSQRAEVARLTVTLPERLQAAFRAGSADLLEAGSIAAIEVATGEAFDCNVELAAS
jgi:valyl-tRNA synthetase